MEKASAIFSCFDTVKNRDIEDIQIVFTFFKAWSFICPTVVNTSDDDAPALELLFAGLLVCVSRWTVQRPEYQVNLHYQRQQLAKKMSLINKSTGS